MFGLRLFLFYISIIFFFHHVSSLEGEGILGGLETEPNEIKYMVAIQHEGDLICGGSIIDKSFILTAAHCLVDESDNFRTGRFSIIAGSRDLKVRDSSTIEINVEAIYVPANYNGTLWQTIFPPSDIAVLKLVKPLDLSLKDKLKQLRLPAVTDNYEPYLYQVAVVTGYGLDRVETINVDGQVQVTNVSTSFKMYKANSIVFDYVECSNHYETMYPSNLCGKVINYEDDTPQGVCEGDSGGPLVYNDDIVIGVVSGSAPACNENEYPSVYTRVASFVRFIRNAKKGLRLNMRVKVGSDGVF